MASEMSDDMSEVGGENEGIPVSSASSISNDQAAELTAVMSETEDSNSCLEPSSSETDSYLGTGSKVKDDGSCKSSSSDLTVGSSTTQVGDDGTMSSSKVKFPVRPGIVWKKGERLEAEDYQRNWYSSKIMNINEDTKTVLIHFEGWNQRYDEWMEMDSERLRPLTRHSERRDKRRRGKTVYKVGDQVLAKWTDCKMYLAKIDEVLADGSYMVLFYDGFRKNIQPINLRPAPLDQKQQKFQIKPPVLSPKDLKNMRTKPVDFKGKAGAAPEGSTTTTTTTTTTSQNTEKPKVGRPPGQGLGAQKKAKLIVSGSLFSKKARTPSTTEGEQEGVPQKKVKEGFKVKMKVKQEDKGPKEEVKVKQEPKVSKEEETKAAEEEVVKVEEGVEESKAEATAEAATAVGAEASCQTYPAVAAPATAKKPGRRRARSGTFPGEKRRRRKLSKGPRSASRPRLIKKARSTDSAKPLDSPSLPVPPPLPLLPQTFVPAKAFRVEVDHNPFKCEECGKGFRKNQLLMDHIKHYHKPEGLNLTPAPQARRRKKTLSSCVSVAGSTDSDMSMSSKGHSSKRRRHISEVSVGSPDIAMKMSFDEEGPSGMGTEGVTESPVVEAEEEASDEVVNCVCGNREETGTMIQCDCCQCWQHIHCCGMTEEDLASDTFPTTYVCIICKYPTGVRESSRHLYDMDWFRKGQLARFSFVPGRENEERNKEMLNIHDLMAQLLAINKVMHGLREEIALTGEKEHPELRLWQPQPPKESRSIAISTSDDKEEEAPAIDTELPTAVQLECETLHTQDILRDSTPAEEATPLGGATPEGLSSASQLHEQTGEGNAALSSDLTEKAVVQNGDSQSEVKSGEDQVVETNVTSTVATEQASENDSKNLEQPVNPPVLENTGNTAQTDSSQSASVEGTVDEGAAMEVGGGKSGKKPEVPAVSGQPSEQEGHAGIAGEEVKVEPSATADQEPEEATVVVRRDPNAEIKLAVLQDVRSKQDELFQQLEQLELQISAMERREFGADAASCYTNINSLKHALSRQSRDLKKVKTIASYR